MNRNINLFIVPFACFLFCATLVAQSPDETEGINSDERTTERENDQSGEKLEDVVVTDTRTETERDNSGSSVTVIDRDEIRRRDKRSVHELLRTIEGVRVSQSGGPGKATSVFLRGAESNHTLVLIDGTRVNSTTTGGFDFAGLTADHVQRIEILRGPQSPLYGSEAIGGVINVITQKGEDGFHGEVRAEGGSHDSGFGRAHARGGTGPYDVSISVSERRTDGVSAAESGTEEDGYENTTVSGRFGRTFLKDGRVELTARLVDDENELDGTTFGGTPVDDPNFVQKRDAIYTALNVTKPITDWWDQKVQFGYTADDLEGMDPDTPFNNFSIDSRITNYHWQSEIHPVDWNTVTAGYEVEERRGEVSGSFDRSLTVHSIYLQDRVTIGERWSVRTGVRHDDYDTFGTETTYQVASSLRFPAWGTRFHGQYGTGFRAPALTELFFPNFGNPNLAPEESSGYDAGVEQSFLDERLTVDVTYFQNRIDDLIVFAGGTNRNVDRAETDGWELAGEAIVTDFWTVSSTYTYTDARNETSDQPLSRRPEQKFTVRNIVEVDDRLSGSVAWHQFHGRYDAGDRLDDYGVLDVSLRYQLLSSLTLTARLNNVLDEDYNEVPGFTSPGANGYVGLAYEW